MALVATLLTGNYDNVDRTAYTTASISPAANSVLYLFYTTRHATTGPNMTPSGVTGITWTRKTSQVDGISLIGVWEGVVGGSPGTGALTLTIDGGVTAIGCEWSIIQVTGADTSAPTVQTPLGATGSTGTASSLTFAAASAAGNRFFSYHLHRANEVTNPRTNWTELDDRAGSTPNSAHELQWRNDGTNETTASASWTTSSRWQALGVEVKVATSGAVALDGTSAGTSSTSGDIVLTIALSGQSDGVSSDTGDIILSIALSGQSDGTSTTTGDLTVSTTVLLDGTSAGVSTATGDIALSLPLSGTSGGVSSDVGDIVIAIALSGSTDGVSTASGDLTIGAIIALDGSSAGVSGASGELTFVLPEPIVIAVMMPSSRGIGRKERRDYRVIRRVG